MSCLSHTIMHIGEHLLHVILTKVREDLCAMLNANGGSNKATKHWFYIFGLEWCPPGTTRWWEIIELLY